MSGASVSDRWRRFAAVALTGLVLVSSSCRTFDGGIAAAGGVVVLGAGGAAAIAVSQSTAYDPALRGDDGRLVPVARQPEYNLIPVAVGIGVGTAVVSGLLFTYATFDQIGPITLQPPAGDGDPGSGPGVGDAPPLPVTFSDTGEVDPRGEGVVVEE